MLDCQWAGSGLMTGVSIVLAPATDVTRMAGGMPSIGHVTSPLSSTTTPVQTSPSETSSGEDVGYGSGGWMPWLA